ncbi:hypothetical protein [Streptomyces olivoreticuli]|uniref:hypothetical protein n=1 Tax=Streptomyces olivoreticuli TaxID=68246 RepID=UPI000E24ADC2|nr:hypothetical protein [Streptomyces olivoreticuli]
MTGTSTDPKDTPPAELTVSQDRLATMLAREKDQGGRAAVRSLVERLGFSDSEALEQYVSVVRKAQQDELSDAQYREAMFTEREKTLVAREAAAEARERAAIRRAHLAEAGAKGQDLDDAMTLLRVEDDADDAQLADAVGQLAARRPELFARTTAHLPAVPAPAGAPASVPPPRSPGVSHTPGAAGLEMARRRGLLPPTT